MYIRFSFRSLFTKRNPICFLKLDCLVLLFFFCNFAKISYVIKIFLKKTCFLSVFVNIFLYFHFRSQIKRYALFEFRFDIFALLVLTEIYVMLAIKCLDTK